MLYLILSLLPLVHSYSTLLYRVGSTYADVLAPSQDPWYSAPSGWESSAPGTVLRVRAAPGNLTSIITNSSAAYNILYSTTDSNYNATWAVTTLLIPHTPAQPQSGVQSSQPNSLLSYQIPYDSADVDASPSHALYGNDLAEVELALEQGWYVSVPDYEGPFASFTAGVQSGHATLDSVRAVMRTGFGLSDQTRYAMWGYSGGALASEWAAELQKAYAPELSFAGAALGGLTPNISSVLLHINEKISAGLGPAGTVGLASQHPELQAFLEENLKKEGQYNATTFMSVKGMNLAEAIGAFANQDLGEYFVNGLQTLESPLAEAIQTSDGFMGLHGVPQMPLFVYKAIGDEISPTSDTDALVQKYCDVGVSILYQRNEVGEHTSESLNGRVRALMWLSAALDGKLQQTGCQVEVVNVTAT
ncbi:LIP-domain-containing protein [Piedraia hortae CBS 480.64]|uniref:LIP-domain-containing protein n=1 Tax=Piedraia hortae CBS 480.64 TaxID=1314780 RepID=A0A6A7C214_9PEZI|nr:LIP-domain-containing protein [Piedraia hortae CBS 480.64]